MTDKWRNRGSGKSSNFPTVGKVVKFGLKSMWPQAWTLYLLPSVPFLDWIGLLKEFQRRFFWPSLACKSLASFFFFFTCSNPSYDLLCFHGKCLILILGHKPYILWPNQGSRPEPPVESLWHAICRCKFYLWWDSLIAMGFWAALLFISSVLLALTRKP